MTVFDDLAARMRDVAKHHARVESPPVMRFKVRQASPLIIEHLGAADIVLEEGDPDFEISDAVDMAAPQVGDLVIVHADSQHDYIATTTISRGNYE